MRRFGLKIILLAFFALFGATTFATTADKKVKEIVDNYKDVKGVEIVEVTKGNGLEFVKMMFKKQFGKEFMRGVTSITIIGYSDASEAVCSSLRKDLDIFTSVLEEFDLSGNKDFSKNEYVRCFAQRTENGTLSDFVVAMEQDQMKMVVYMAGEIKIEKE